MIDEKHRLAVYEELKRQVQEYPADDKTLHMSQFTARQLFSDDNDRYFTITKDGKYARFCDVPITWTSVERTAIRLYAGDAMIYSIIWDPNPDKKKLTYSGPQAMRFNDGKLQWALIDFKQLEGMVRVLEFGAKKYTSRVSLSYNSLHAAWESTAPIIETSLFLRGVCVAVATTNGSRPTIPTTVGSKLRIAEHGPLGTVNTSGPTSNSERSDLDSENITEGSISYSGSRSSDWMSNATVSSRNRDAAFAAARNTYTLITTIRQDSSEEYCVANATTESACSAMMWQEFVRRWNTCNAQLEGSEIVISGRDNWKKGLPMRQQCESMMRHLVAIMDGEVKDKETGEYHWHCIMCNAMFMNHTYLNHPEHIDLPAPKPEPA